MKELLTVFGLALLPALGNFSGGLNRIYRYLFAAQVIAITGAGLSTVALTLLAYALAGAMPARCWAPPWPSR